MPLYPLSIHALSQTIVVGSFGYSCYRCDLAHSDRKSSDVQQFCISPYLSREGSGVVNWNSCFHGVLLFVFPETVKGKLDRIMPHDHGSCKYVSIIDTPVSASGNSACNLLCSNIWYALFTYETDARSDFVIRNLSVIHLVRVFLWILFDLSVNNRKQFWKFIWGWGIVNFSETSSIIV